MDHSNTAFLVIGLVAALASLAVIVRLVVERLLRDRIRKYIYEHLKFRCSRCGSVGRYVDVQAVPRKAGGTLFCLDCRMHWDA